MQHGNPKFGMAVQRRAEGVDLSHWWFVVSLPYFQPFGLEISQALRAIEIDTFTLHQDQTYVAEQSLLFFGFPVNMTTSTDLAFREIGQGVPVLIIHGWTMAGFVESYDFEPIFTKRPGYRRIYVDLPGMGKSLIGTTKDLDSMLESVCRVVEKHILPSNFLLAGSSCGAYLARAVAYRYADAVEGLLLRVPLVEPESSKRDIDPFVPAVSNPDLLSTLSESDRQMLGDIPIQTPEYIDIIRWRFEATVVPAVAASDATALDPIRNDPNRYRLTSKLHSPEAPFRKPTLILLGRHDTDVGYRDAWSIVECYPRATFAVLDRENHDLSVDQTDLFVSLVYNWLWRVEEMVRMRSQQEAEK